MDLTLIKKVAAQKKIKLDDLAEMADIKRATFFNYLSGKTSISAASLKVLSEVLEIPVTLFYSESNYLDLDELAEPMATYRSRKNIQEVPLVHKYVYNDFLKASEPEKFLNTLPKYPVLLDSSTPGFYLCFEVTGDDMFDGTHHSRLSGDIILVREIQNQHWSSDLSLQKNNMLIVLKEDLMYKQITAHDLEKNRIIVDGLHTQFEACALDLDEVISIFAEVRLVSRHSG